MFLKRTHTLPLLVALALLGVSAGAPAATQASTAHWYEAGKKVAAETSIDGEVGSFFLKTNISGTAVSLYCFVTYNGTIDNQVTPGAGQLENVSFESCGSEFGNPAFENCWAEVNADNTPWPVQASSDTSGNFAVKISAIDTTITFYTLPTIPPPTPACPIAGRTYRSMGAISGAWSNGAPSALDFEEATGLTLFSEGVPVGSLKVTAAFSVTGEGTAITLSES